MVEQSLLRKEAGKRLRLTREQEHDYAVRWRDHRDEVARDMLFRSQLHMVVFLGRRYEHMSTYDDVLTEGAIGLLTAIDAFKPDLGTRLSTYCKRWIMVRMSERADVRQVHIPPKVAQAMKRAIRLHVGCPDWETLAKQFRRDQGTIREIAAQLETSDESLDETVFETPGGRPIERGEVFADTDLLEEKLIGDDQKRDRNDWLWRAKNALSRRERYVIERRFSLDEPRLVDLANEMGVSHERVRQIEARAMRKLRLFAKVMR